VNFFTQCDEIADLVVESRKFERECLNVDFHFPAADGGAGFAADDLDYDDYTGLTNRPTFLYAV